MKFLITAAVLLAASVAVFAEDVPDYRLPAGITPNAQSIELRLDPADEKYSGRVEIDLAIVRAVERIGINQIGLTMNSIVLSANGKQRTLQASDSEWERSWLSDGRKIAPGDYTLTIEFDGTYSTDSLGMHRVSFEGNDYVFTQMESMYARRAFPVFDEPGFKIPYQLTIVAPAGLAVVANSPVDAQREDKGWQRVRFMQTPPLPSYLLAYAVGPLDRAPIEGMSIPGFVYTPKGHADKLGFVLRETPTIVATLEQYFDKKYPYRKLDFLAVPEFAFGAMENPGLITYRTDLMLVGDELSGARAEAVVNVIAHEVAHIWYGDLVTMAWWNDLWLNEAFASWMSRKVLKQAYPQYESDLKLPQNDAFPADQLTTSKPIRKTVRNTEEIFDGIGLNYTKGEALLTMLENYVGQDAWQRGIRQYIEQYAWKNATETDLWTVTSDASGLDVSLIAGDFLNKPGFPSLAIGNDGSVEQERYLVEGRKAADLEWHIPLNVKYKADGEVRQTFVLLKAKTGSLDVPANADWIFPDAGGSGYYRWSVTSDKFYNLVDDAGLLSNRERIALLDNSQALLDAGTISLADYMFVLNKLLDDPHPLVFLPTLEKLKAIGEKYVDASNRALFSAYVDRSLTERYGDAGVQTRPDDSEAMQQMRPRLLRTLGQFGSDESVRKAAAELSSAYLDSADSVQPGLALEALRVSAMNGDRKLYERYRKAYLESESEGQKSNILSSIYFSDPEIVKRHLDFSISPAVPAGDAATGISLFAYLLEDDSILYEWLAANLDAFEAKIPEYQRNALPQIIGDTCNEKGLSLLQEFFGDRGDKYATSLAKQVETTESCIASKKRQAADFNQFLEQYGS